MNMTDATTGGLFHNIYELNYSIKLWEKSVKTVLFIKRQA